MQYCISELGNLHSFQIYTDVHENSPYARQVFRLVSTNYNITIRNVLQKNVHRAGGMAQTGEHLPTKREALFKSQHKPKIK
jgi:hypothetical protein